MFTGVSARDQPFSNRDFEILVFSHWDFARAWINYILLKGNSHNGIPTLAQGVLVLAWARKYVGKILSGKGGPGVGSRGGVWIFRFLFLFFGGGGGFAGGCGNYVCLLCFVFCVSLPPGRAPTNNDACMSRLVSNVLGTFFAVKCVEIAWQCSSLELCCFPWLRFCKIYELVRVACSSLKSDELS